jgi:hypothetical protein
VVAAAAAAEQIPLAEDWIPTEGTTLDPSSPSQHDPSALTTFEPPSSLFAQRTQS